MSVALELELANTMVRLRPALKTAAIAAFNARMGTCTGKQWPIHRMMREQPRKLHATRTRTDILKTKTPTRRLAFLLKPGRPCGIRTCDQRIKSAGS
jgi:hypothetical protein